MKQVSVLVGAGSIGQAIIRRVSAGKHIVLADYSIENAQRAAKTLENAGFECSTIRCDLGSKEDILKFVEFARRPTGMATYNTSRLHTNEIPFHDTVSRNDNNNDHTRKDGRKSDKIPLPRNVRGHGGKGHDDTKPCPCR